MACVNRGKRVAQRAPVQESKSKSQARLRPDPCHLTLAWPVCACLLQPRLSLPVVLPDVNTAHVATPCGLQFWLLGS